MRALLAALFALALGSVTAHAQQTIISSAVIGSTGTTLTFTLNQAATCTAADFSLTSAGTAVPLSNTDCATSQTTHVFTVLATILSGRATLYSVSTTAATSPALAATVSGATATNNSTVAQRRFFDEVPGGNSLPTDVVPIERPTVGAPRGYQTEYLTAQALVAGVAQTPTYLSPSGGDDSSAMQAALANGFLGLLPGQTYKICTGITVNPITQTVRAEGAIINASCMPQPAIIANTEMVQFATSTPTVSSGTATQSGSSWNFAGTNACAGYLITLYPQQTTTITLTYTGSPATINLNAYIPATTQSSANTPTCASGTGGSSPVTKTTINNGNAPQVFWVSVGVASGTANVTAFTATHTGTFQSQAAVVTFDSGNTPPQIPSTGGQGFERHFAHPWSGGVIEGAGAGGYPAVATPGVVAFAYNSNDATAARTVQLAMSHVVVDGFQFAEIFENNTFSIHHEFFECYYSGTCVSLAGAFNSGEVYSYVSSVFADSTTAFNTAAGGSVDCDSCHMDYNNNLIQYGVADFNYRNGWIETDRVTVSGVGYQIAQTYGRVSFTGTYILFIGTPNAANVSLFAIGPPSGSNVATLGFDDCTITNMVGANGTPNLNHYSTGTILFAGKVTTTGLAGGPNYVRRGFGPYVDNPVQAAITSPGSTLTVTMPNSGAATQKITLNTNLAITLTAPTGFPDSGETRKLDLALVNGAASIGPSFTNTIAWAGGTAPTFSTANGAENDVTLTTFDNGATWHGHLGLD